jgi:hypothetical protein
MPRGDRSASTDRKKRQAGAVDNGYEQKGTARPGAEARAWPAVHKLHPVGMKVGRKVPSGPVGGSGRKTNLARSS